MLPHISKFILLTVPRSGSNLLANILDLHPEIRCISEDGDWPSKRECEAFVRLVPPARNIQTQIRLGFEGFVAPEPVRGYKLFYHHLAGCATRNSENQFMENEYVDTILGTDIKIVHLVRPNVLDRIVSMKMARRTSQWSVSKGSKAVKAYNSSEVTIDVENLVSDIERCQRRHRLVRTVFADQLFEVRYPTLFDQLPDLYKWLGCEQSNVEPPLLKQRRTAKCDLISNWESVVETLSGTRHSWMLKG